ncbi:CpaD family pilus assembly lipoprotein [Sphingomonas desiccabilis]|uniref:Pilus assembly protein CpaD n=1 Tax=Sphingomonas desiccabilis TaxID=429134 RepID=A0A4Q2ITH3_9SPHN|nr:CpaD family pilus assembly lipoprotein [Sphingomonas desiccabilis]MBB3911545.1 pilus assembly protein CpaD [Sphingomonas desiccabilis]RXZ31701.1 pilus assembly protein CpaD [Sphingomonas desiccabilis]
MYSRLAAVALCAPALLLAACDPGANRGLESVNQPVVSRSDYAVDLATTTYGLSEGEAGRLAGWLAALQPGYGDRIAVDDPAGATGARAQVAAEAARYGLLLADTASPAPSAVAPGTVRVVLTRASASVPSCPRSDPLNAYTFDSHTHPNYGCAVNSNLAAMVARPEDLIHGQTGTGVSDPVNAARAIQAYRGAASNRAGGLSVQGTAGGAGSGGGLGASTTGSAGN